MKRMKKLTIAAGATVLAAVFGLAACNLATSGFGTITMPGEWPELPPSEPPPPALPPPPPSFSLENLQYNDYWQWVVTDDDTVIITRYLGLPGHVDIPASLDGLPVASIGRPLVMPTFFQRPAVFAGMGVTSVSIPPGLPVIGAGAFMNTELTHVYIPHGVTAIEIDAFAHNMRFSLASVSIPGSVTSIGHSAFRSSGLTGRLEIPYGVTSIAIAAFDDNRISSLSLPASLTHIGEIAFAGNPQLTSVVIPASVTSIDNRAFNLSELQEVRFLGAISIDMVGSLNEMAPLGGALGIFHCAFPGNLREQAVDGYLSGTFTRSLGGDTWVRQP